MRTFEEVEGYFLNTLIPLPPDECSAVCEKGDNMGKIKLPSFEDVAKRAPKRRRLVKTTDEANEFSRLTVAEIKFPPP